jgi:hypothetical protein
MKQEMALVAATCDPTLAGNAARKTLREQTDVLIREALQLNSLPALAAHAGQVMLTVAQILVNAQAEPDVPDLIEATQALIEDGRAVMDRGLMIDSRETLLCGAVMLELACRGIFHALGLPYEAVLSAVLAGVDLAALLPPKAGEGTA